MVVTGVRRDDVGPLLHARSLVDVLGQLGVAGAVDVLPRRRADEAERVRGHPDHGAQPLVEPDHGAVGLAPDVVQVPHPRHRDPGRRPREPAQRVKEDVVRRSARRRRRFVGQDDARYQQHGLPRRQAEVPHQVLDGHLGGGHCMAMVIHGWV